MAVHKKQDGVGDRQPSMTDNDRAWGPIFGVVIIAGLVLAALFFFVSSGSNRPIRQATSSEVTAPPTRPATPGTQRP